MTNISTKVREVRLRWLGQVERKTEEYVVIRLIHVFSITGLIVRQPLLMADQACNCWLFFISNKFSGLIFNIWNMIYNLISE